MQEFVASLLLIVTPTFPIDSSRFLEGLVSTKIKCRHFVKNIYINYTDNSIFISKID